MRKPATATIISTPITTGGTMRGIRFFTVQFSFKKPQSGTFLGAFSFPVEPSPQIGGAISLVL